MKVSLIILLCLLVNNALSFNYYTYKAGDDVTVDSNINIDNPEYLNDLNLYKKFLSSNLVTTCMVQLRNVLYSENKTLKKILSQTTLPKDKLFDRLVLDLFNKCKDELSSKTQNDALGYLTPENVGTINNELTSRMVLEESNYSNDARLIKFDDKDLELLNVFYNTKSDDSNKKNSKNEVEKKISFTASTPLIHYDPISLITNFNYKIVKYVVYGAFFGVISGFVIAKILESKTSSHNKYK